MAVPAMHARMLFIGIGFVLFGVYLLSGGSLVPNSDPSISIEWGLVTDDCEGAEVVLDGEPVGTLEWVGRSSRNVFRVERGVHQIALRGTRCHTSELRVDTPLRAQNVMLVLDYLASGETTSALGRIDWVISSEVDPNGP
jgi:hypothetical protein